MQQRVSLFALIAGAALPIVIFSAIMIVLFERQQQQSVQEALQQAARTTINAIDRQIGNNFSTLQALAAAVQNTDPPERAFRLQAHHLLRQRPDWLAISVMQMDGARQVIDLASPVAPSLPSANDVEAAEAVARTQAPTVGTLVSRAAPDLPAHVLLHVPVHADGGRLSHVLSLAVLADSFSSIIAKEGLSPDWTAAVLEQSKTIVARSRNPEAYVGTRATPSLLEQLERRSEHFFFALNKEGDRVYTAFSRSPFSGWTSAVGAPAAAVETPLRRTLWVIFGGGSLALLLTVLLALLLTGNYLRRQAAEKRLTDLEARQTAERRLSDIAANFPGIIFRRVMHPDGSFTYPYVSDEALALDMKKVKPNQRLSLDEIGSNMLPEDRSLWRREIMESARSLKSFRMEGRYIAAAGEQRWLRSVAHTQLEADGSVVWDGVVLDVTDLKEAEEKLAASLAEKETLLKEIHHRVKNNMQVISSLLQLEARRLGDATARQRLDMVAQRIGVMGRIHEQLYSSERFAAIDFGTHLRELAGSLAELHRPAQGIEVRVRAERLLCDLDTAMPLGLVAHELIFNSLKHAFNQASSGHIDVRLHRNDAGDVEFCVADSGTGLREPQGAPGSASGLGLHLVRALASQLEADVRFDINGGTRVVLLIPGRHFSGPEPV